MYLGMVLKQLKDGNICMHMNGYIDELIREYLSRRTVKESKYLAACNLFQIDPDSNILSEVNKKFFHKIVAKMVYLCRVRPPMKQDENMLDKLIGYFKHAKHQRRVILGKG